MPEFLEFKFSKLVYAIENSNWDYFSDIISYTLLHPLAMPYF